MSRNRVAAGIPTGGQFAQQARTESPATLDGSSARMEATRLRYEDRARVRRQQAEEARSAGDTAMPAAAADRPRNVGFMAGSDTVMDWDNSTPVDPGTLTGEELERLRHLSEASGLPLPREIRRAMNRRRPSAADTAEKLVDEIAETGEALSGLAGHLADIQRGKVPVESEGSFVGWGDILPKFLRRKDQPAVDPAVAEAAARAQATAESRRRIAEAVGDLAVAVDRLDRRRR